MPRRQKRYSNAGPLGSRGLDPYRPDQSAFYFKPAEARAEYARLRREANRRLDLMRASEFKNFKAIKNRPQNYEALPKNASETQVRSALFDVARYISLKTSSVRGARRTVQKILETLQDHDYTFINKNNILNFMEFMGEVEKHKAAKGLPSGDKVLMWKTAYEKRIDTLTLAKDFDFWLEHRKELYNAPRSRSTVTSEEMAARIGLSID